MFSPFDEEEAYKYCSDFVTQLHNHKGLEQISRESLERKDNGIMTGVLVCKDSTGNKIILKTVSGFRYRINLKAEDNEIFVEPIVSNDEIQKALSANDLKIHQLTNKIKESQSFDEKNALQKERRILTDQSLDKVFDLYSFHCIDGKIRSLKEICRIKNIPGLPPAGTGDCCAPKLLDYAFRHNLTPLSMCEILYKKTDNGILMNRYPPCDERCGILLPVMLGLEILYRDQDILVVNKQSGLLSVPGRGPDKQDCIVNRMKELFPETIEQPAVHRLDMETSGIMILAFNAQAHKNLNKQFENGQIKKEYTALLDGVLAKKGIPESGMNELYFRLDVDNRPHQIWDPVYGKKAVTEWNILGVENYHAPDGSRRPCTRVLFKPHTGRTHQLRLASSDSHGFGIPIIGDTLYGKCDEGERLMLHASYISFCHPVTGKQMEFRSKSPF
ncbi:RluA family pseudouridine synthase [Treponema sp.]|uniref:RluA family pseudouridine synthase n=1 Tax=Treponema sp. TaxID=166 RepID=UPI0025EFB254|nr:RluA family pseudouridine synthase [Treponema sp.]MCR5217603.1 RluA family pseudouridine synthase [Treponema sp.]